MMRSSRTVAFMAITYALSCLQSTGRRLAAEGLNDWTKVPA
jgi:hypothetical protein